MFSSETEIYAALMSAGRIVFLICGKSRSGNVSAVYLLHIYYLDVGNFFSFLWLTKELPKFFCFLVYKRSNSSIKFVLYSYVAKFTDPIALYKGVVCGRGW